MAKSAGKSQGQLRDTASSSSLTPRGTMTAAKRSSASSPQDRQPNTSDVDTKAPKIVRYELDLLNPPPLTAKQVKRLEALANLRDEDIDFSDIPPLTDE